ncbi:hypothetical protein SKAU_G00352430 [Synaphobranchus kaupii]|uniref:Uncharacterized protein n=1 Tax=Synaphobranchus kaupii TaxID=118154 RepID=A0A9Q1EKS5_SYNKA|nr:hypothetical protein SKAU_G00352430 [Synaphobranchus kaupii]
MGSEEYWYAARERSLLRTLLSSPPQSPPPRSSPFPFPHSNRDAEGTAIITFDSIIYRLRAHKDGRSRGDTEENSDAQRCYWYNSCECRRNTNPNHSRQFYHCAVRRAVAPAHNESQKHCQRH